MAEASACLGGRPFSRAAAAHRRGRSGWRAGRPFAGVVLALAERRPMPSFSARRLLRGLAALTLVVGAFGLQACGAAGGADDCQDCGPSTCTAPTACTNRGVELEVQKIFSSDEA